MLTTCYQPSLWDRSPCTRTVPATFHVPITQGKHAHVGRRGDIYEGFAKPISMQPTSLGTTPGRMQQQLTSQPGALLSLSGLETQLPTITQRWERRPGQTTPATSRGCWPVLLRLRSRERGGEPMPAPTWQTKDSKTQTILKEPRSTACLSLVPADSDDDDGPPPPAAPVQRAPGEGAVKANGPVVWEATDSPEVSRLHCICKCFLTRNWTGNGFLDNASRFNPKRKGERSKLSRSLHPSSGQKGITLGPPRGPAGAPRQEIFARLDSEVEPNRPPSMEAAPLVATASP